MHIVVVYEVVWSDRYHIWRVASLSGATVAVSGAPLSGIALSNMFANLATCYMLQHNQRCDAAEFIQTLQEHLSGRAYP